MAHPQDKKRRARGLYVQSRMTIPAIAITIDASEGTVRRWKADAKTGGDDWDIARAAATMQGEGFEAVIAEAVEGFTVMFQATMEQIREETKIQPADKVKLMASLSDAFNKMINASGRAAPKLRQLAQAIDLLRLLAEFVSREFPQHRDVFIEVVEPFAAELARRENAAA